MTVRMLADSPMRAHAARFGTELVRAMSERGIAAGPLRKAAGIGSSSIVSEWRHGRNLPGIETAQRLADALDWPKLATIVREARTGACRTCGDPIIIDAGRPRLYCTRACRDIARVMRDGSSPDGAAQARSMLLGEVLRSGPARKQVIGRAVTILEDARSGELAVAAVLPVYREAVAAFCRGCEPEGLCRDAACPLRPVSPLDLSVERREATTAVPPPGRWGREGAREAFAAAMRERWADPDRRVRQSERNRARLAALTPEQRAERARRISEGRRRGRDAA